MFVKSLRPGARLLNGPMLLGMLMFACAYVTLPHKSNQADGGTLDKNWSSATWHVGVCGVCVSCQNTTSEASNKAADIGKPAQQDGSAAAWLMKAARTWYSGGYWHFATWNAVFFLTCVSQFLILRQHKAASQQWNPATCHAGFGCTSFPFLMKHLMRPRAVTTLGSTPMLLLLLLGTLHDCTSV